ncbi:MAG: RHS repeat-associated core domain-containing protein, partial [Flavobacterium sp.]
EFFPTAEGFYDYKKDQYIYQYRDHLGNARVSFGRNSAGALEITDANDYYPFGMNHLKTGNAFFGAGSYKNYKYNGKELQETGMYDYGARFYMPDIGRWGVVDPLAEKYTRMSPYTYVGNNPAIFVDYDGRDFGMSVDMKKGTITITGNYYALSRDMKAANGAIGKWNKVSGNYSYNYKDSNGVQKSLKVVFKLTATEVKSTAKADLKNALNTDKSGIGNSFIVDDKRMEKQSSTTEGITMEGQRITVRSTSSDDTGGHEVGHTLGLDDDQAVSSDIMTHTTESGDSINSTYIEGILSYFDGNTTNPNKASDKTKIDGNPRSVVIDTTSSNLKTEKDYESFKKGKVKSTPTQ